MNDVQSYVDLGYKVARRIAGKHSNCGNAAEFAASSVACEFQNVYTRGEVADAVLTAQWRSGLNLTALLTISDAEDQKTAVAAFVGGCYRYAADVEDGEDEAE